MTKKGFKIFIAAFVLSLPFWWGMNLFAKNLENFIYTQKIEESPQTLIAQINPLPMKKLVMPVRNQEMGELTVAADSAISVLITEEGQDKILFEKNIDGKLPVASITKLMTAIAVMENYDLSQTIKISEQAVSQDGEASQFRIGEEFTVKNLLYPLLIESSNDAAWALSEVMGPVEFVLKMNETCKKIGMENTYFINPTGVDPNEPEGLVNYSTAQDLVKLAKYVAEKPEIIEILSLKEFNLYSADGISHHRLLSTNELLGENPQIIGGKTGWTPRAKGCLLLFLENPYAENSAKDLREKSYQVNIVLGSEDRFGEMEKLIGWINSAYVWR